MMLATLRPTVQCCEQCRVEGCLATDRGSDEAARSSSQWARTMHRFLPRQVVFHEGTPSSTMYFLCRGEVKLSVQGLSGSRRIVSILSAARSPGDMLDKPSLGAAVHAMTCETLTESLVCCVNKTDWLWWVRQDQELVDRVLTAAGNETIGLLRQLRENLDVQAGRKLARTLLSLADQHGLPTPQGIELDLKLRRREWAELVGLSRETVARLLNGLRRDGVLALSGNRITIVGYDRLAKLA